MCSYRAEHQRRAPDNKCGIALSATIPSVRVFVKYVVFAMKTLRLPRGKATCGPAPACCRLSRKTIPLSQTPGCSSSSAAAVLVSTSFQQCVGDMQCRHQTSCSPATLLATAVLWLCSMLDCASHRTCGLRSPHEPGSTTDLTSRVCTGLCTSAHALSQLDSRRRRAGHSARRKGDSLSCSPSCADEGGSAVLWAALQCVHCIWLPQSPGRTAFLVPGKNQGVCKEIVPCLRVQTCGPAQARRSSCRWLSAGT